MRMSAEGQASRWDQSPYNQPLLQRQEQPGGLRGPEDWLHPDQSCTAPKYSGNRSPGGHMVPGIKCRHLAELGY